MYHKTLARDEMQTWTMAQKVTKEMISRYLSPDNKLGRIMKHFCWSEEDFCQEFLLHLLHHNKKSTTAWREKWLQEIDWSYIGNQKSFRAWTKVEMKSFVGRLFYREIMAVKSSDLKIALDDADNEVEAIEVDGEQMIMNKLKLQKISKFIQEEATEKEVFIYMYLIGLEDIVTNETGMRIINYPGGGCAKRIFYEARQKLIDKLENL
jgi:hypothetical protein